MANIIDIDENSPESKKLLEERIAESYDEKNLISLDEFSIWLNKKFTQLKEEKRAKV